MKFGVRECCDVVLRAKARQQIGNKVFYKNEPVIYFDTLTTSSMEGSATTVYAQGGRGNSRLMSWDGERTVTFTMEDALISAEGLMILSGAGLFDASSDTPVIQHVTEMVSRDSANIAFGSYASNTFTEETDASAYTNTDDSAAIQITLSKTAYLPDDKQDNVAYVMFMRDGEIISEPYIPVHLSGNNVESTTITLVKAHSCYPDGTEANKDRPKYGASLPVKEAFDAVLVDFYHKHDKAAKQIEITPDKFGGAFYLEASTLFRDTNGVDYPAEFIIPNCRIQSNFTFTMASTGDPSTFTFTMDAFPDYTRWDKSKKVLAAIQIIEATDDGSSVDAHRGWSQSNESAPEAKSASAPTHDDYNASTKTYTPVKHPNTNE